MKRADELDVQKKSVLQKLEKSHDLVYELENRLCEITKIPSGNVIIDLPTTDILRSEPRISKVDVKILDDNGNLLSLEKCSSLSKAVETRAVTSWAIMVIVHPKYAKKIGGKIEKVLFA
jgi:HD superfamily phosphohydrolase